MSKPEPIVEYVTEDGKDWKKITLPSGAVIRTEIVAELGLPLNLESEELELLKKMAEALKKAGYDL